jgi:hypothetical protein
MKVTLAAYEKKTLNSSGGYFTVLGVSDGIELSFKGAEDIPLELGSQVEIGAVAQIVLQNINNAAAFIEFTISSLSVERKTQSVKSEITNAITIDSMPAVQVEATVAASSVAGEPINITLAAGQSGRILPENNKRHTATIVRGEADLYNIRLAYSSAANAENGLPFAPQATASVKSKVSVWAHNHSDSPQAIIAIDTSIL